MTRRQPLQLSRSACSFLLIRHAQSTWNAEGRWQGHGDPPLSELGRRQAEALARSLAAEGIELLVSSDLSRAAQTAAVLGERLGLVARHDARMRELDIGCWTGLTHAEIERGWPAELAQFIAGDALACAGGAECRAVLERRCREAIAEIAQRHAGSRVAVVTHLGVILSLVPGAQPDNAGVVRLEPRSQLGGSWGLSKDER
jgi:probable phosphoglycerate mutase